MNSEPALTKASTSTNRWPSQSKTSRPPGTSSTRAANAICRVTPVPTSFQSTRPLLLENSQVIPMSTARPKMPKPIRVNASIVSLFPWDCRRRAATGQRSAGPGGGQLGSGVAGDDPVAPGGLGRLDPAVGTAEQPRSGGAVLGPRGQPRAEGEGEGVLAACGQERALDQGPAQAVQALPGAAGGAGQHHHELLAADPGQGLVLGQHAAHGRGDVAQ